MKTVFGTTSKVTVQSAVTLAILLIFQLNSAFSFDDSLKVTHSEVQSYKLKDSKYQAVFEMGYARAEISNPEAWGNDERERRVVEVDLVFTQYPRKKEDWRTNYDTLLNRRINAVKELIPGLKESSDVTWNLILQTECSNETEAKTMFHGAVVKYRIILPKSLRASLNNVRKIVTGRVAFEDSVVFKAFERNPDWKDMLIVKDWTGSMYDYGAQAILWHRLNMEKKAVRHIVFFNDGNMTENSEKKVGATGGIYDAKPDDIKDVISVMREVMLEGNGGDSEENDVEALLYGINSFNDFKEVILIADNKSPVRDISLIEKIHVPVRIILCGTNEAPVVHPHYLKIAYDTGGSIHTIEEDITKLTSKMEGEKIKVLGVEYELKKGQFVPMTEESDRS
ncbi:hypothetical protein [Chondrinema litorale]|uniref:hypothetical protein n=1 Tax=Chondrinema litorale TaxID=2994555 RepID=UPI002543F860|nr:hypothetical protein [Chondrinema litorale]UZR95892.1 hypothetical protein OQ292_08705 [Chondrinema litorale]